MKQRGQIIPSRLVYCGGPFIVAFSQLQKSGFIVLNSTGTPQPGPPHLPRVDPNAHGRSISQISMAHVSAGRPSSGSADGNEWTQAEAYELLEVDHREGDARKPEARALLSDVESKTSLDEEISLQAISDAPDEFSMDEMVARVRIS